MSENPPGPSNVELAVRVGVLESQVSGLTTDLRSHQKYVAAEFARADTKLEAQNRVMAANHAENKSALATLTTQSQELLARTLREDGAEKQRAAAQAEEDRRRAAVQPYVLVFLSSAVTALIGFAIWKLTGVTL